VDLLQGKTEKKIAGVPSQKNRFPAVWPLKEKDVSHITTKKAKGGKGKGILPRWSTTGKTLWSELDGYEWGFECKCRHREGEGKKEGSAETVCRLVNLKGDSMLKCQRKLATTYD